MKKKQIKISIRNNYFINLEEIVRATMAKQTEVCGQRRCRGKFKIFDGGAKTKK